jgi:hypothetical protein
MLYRKGAPVEEIAFVTRSSERLVKGYLKVYKTALEMPHRREKLEEELARVSARQKSPTEEAKRGKVRS